MFLLIYMYKKLNGQNKTEITISVFLYCNFSFFIFIVEYQRFVCYNLFVKQKNIYHTGD